MNNERGYVPIGPRMLLHSAFLLRPCILNFCASWALWPQYASNDQGSTTATSFSVSQYSRLIYLNNYTSGANIIVLDNVVLQNFEGPKHIFII